MIMPVKKGYKQTKEHITKKHLFKIGHLVSSETANKISESNRGKKMSVKTRLKMSKSKKKLHFGYWTGKKRLDLSGKKNPSWKGGITPANKKIRMSLEIKLWRDAVFARDGYMCQKYGTKGGKIVAHHINNFADFPKLRTAIDNGITLSEKAHKEFHKIYGYKNTNQTQLQEFLIS